MAQPATEAAAAAQATGASGPAASSAAPASVAPASSSPGANGALPGLPGLGAAGAAFGADPLARGTGAGEAGPHFTLSPALDSPTFAPALGLQLSVLARDGIERARMQLNPLELGPIGVQLTVTGQQVQLELVAEHARTRQVLEQSLPQLASSLGDAGFTLSGGGVFQHPQQAREGRDGTPGQGSAARPGARETGASEGEATREAALGVRPRAPRGLVDLYA
ncbi:MAG: flagellar hook-length control protein FliK [Rubrivivax sp.]